MRAIVTGQRVSWHLSAPADTSYTSFRRYLDTVFTYAGSHSLEKELTPVRSGEPASAGDVFIQGGFPGHAVIVVDVARQADGTVALLLAQSYMPARTSTCSSIPPIARSAPGTTTSGRARL